MNEDFRSPGVDEVHRDLKKRVVSSGKKSRAKKEATEVRAALANGYLSEPDAILGISDLRKPCADRASLRRACGDARSRGGDQRRQEHGVEST